MKKIISLIVVGLFIGSGLVVVAQPNEVNHIETTRVEFSQPTIVQENNFVSVSISEANSFLMNQGKPLLPSYTQKFYFPFGTRITRVLVTPQDITKQTLSKDIAPTPQMVAVGEKTQPQAVVSVNYGSEPYPSQWFDFAVGGGRHNGELCVIVNVEVYPIIYHPTEKTIVCAQDAEIVVEYEPSNPVPSYRDDYQLVVIGPSEYSSQIAPLIAHKIGRGITSRFVSLTEIYDGTYFPATGRDSQEKIKYFIKDAIESWNTVNILLLGGSSKVPVRETHVYIDGNPPDDEVFVSDLYYADIYNGTGDFCTWDSNNNNIFGEYHWQGQTDAVDMHPDVFLTRLPATSTSQVTAVVNKIKTYENTPGYQQDWFPNLVVVGGDSFPDSGAVNEGEYANQKVVDLMTGFIPNKLWVTNEKLTTLVPTGVANIKNAINSGCGFVDFSGHGNTNIWATHPHDDFYTWVPTPAGGIRTSDITSLSNGNKLPIVTVEACSTAKFASDSNCFNWAFVYTSNGGAIGTFGCTGLGYSYVGNGVTQGLVGKIGLDTYKAYKTDEAISFGEMWASALERYIDSSMDDGDHKTVEEWIAFGDPTLAIAERSEPPVKPSTPAGPASGKVGTEYTYTTSTTDPESDTISYMFDWGDDTTSGWVGPFASGAQASAKKTWTAKGSYQIKVVAKDVHGVLSVWSDPMPITMPTEYTFNHPLINFLEKLLERFPNAFPLLRALLS